MTEHASAAASEAYADTLAAEDEVLAAARARGAEVGLRSVTPSTGAALRVLARMVDARAVVEVGTGAGVSGVWLLRGMDPEGVLTTVDVEAEHHRLARETFVEAGFAPRRARLIAGRAAEVLPRLADASYDLVFLDAEPVAWAEHIAEAARLLRPGGLLVIDDALAGGQVADPAQRDPDTVAAREAVKALHDDVRWVPALLTVGRGLLVALRA